MANDSSNSKLTSTDSAAATQRTLSPWFLLLPLAWWCGLVCWSPNFQWQSLGNSDLSVRTVPYGGDYLQEWVGGTIILSDQRQRLYDLEWVKSQQHDEGLTGVRWPAENYFPMVYPPFHYWLCSPLSALNYRWAFLCWTFLLAAMFALTADLLSRFYGPCRSYIGYALVACLCFVPSINGVTMGQKSAWLLLLFTTVFVLVQHRQRFLGGLVCGLIAIKPQFVILLFALMLWKRQWSFLLGGLTTIGALVCVTAWLEPAWWSDYWNVLISMGNYLDSGGYQLAESHSFWGAAKLSAEKWDIAWLSKVSWVLVPATAVVVFWSWRHSDWHAQAKFPLLFAVMMVATLLISPHLYSYDLTLLFLPAVLMISPEMTRRWRSVVCGLVLSIYGLAGVFVVLAANYGISLSVPLMVGLMLVGAVIVEQARRPSTLSR